MAKHKSPNTAASSASPAILATGWIGLIATVCTIISSYILYLYVQIPGPYKFIIAIGVFVATIGLLDFYYNKSDAAKLPRSCTNMWINLVGVAGFLLAAYLLRKYPGVFSDDPGGPSNMRKLLVCMAGYAAPIAILEFIFLRTFRRESTGYDLSAAQKLDWKRTVTKLIGFYFSLACVGLAYALFPEYQGGIFAHWLYPEAFPGGFYQEFWDFLLTCLPYVMIAAVPYFILMERYSQRPEDGNWQAGLLLMLRFKEINAGKLGQHTLGWLVKAFFLPLMYIYLVGNVNYLITFPVDLTFSRPDLTFNFFWQLFYGIDLIIVTVGYILAVRILDSHIRSAEPTMTGWVVALFCYQPFWSMFSAHYLAYDDDGFDWTTWLAGDYLSYSVWAIGIMVLTFIYAYASVSFGLRFSNLTNRGILTNGAYRFTKHPAYISKNLSWWMMAVPFIIHDGVSTLNAIGSCVLLLCLNYVYFLRARTEERHLSSDPVYVEYALAMNERSMFAWLGKLIPALQYKPYPKLVEIE